MVWKVKRSDLADTVGIRTESLKLPFRIAQQIEKNIIAAGWPVHTVLGSEADLAACYAVGRDTLRETVRILGLRGVAVMRRGPGGGLVVAAPSLSPVVTAFSETCDLLSITDKHIDEARLLIALLRYYTPLVPPGDIGVEQLGRLFEHSGLPLAHPEHAGSPLLGRPRLDSAANAVLDLFESCVNELRMSDNQHAVTVQKLSSEGLGYRGLQLVRTLAFEVAEKARCGEQRIGSEDDLCERYGASKPVVRQAVRVLEMRGILRILPGRSGGLMVGKPSIDATVDLMVTYFSSRRLDRTEVRVPLYLTAKIGRQLAARFLSTDGADQLSRIRQSVTALNENNCVVPIRLDIDAIGNPIVEMFSRVLLLYSINTLALVCRCSDDFVRAFHANLVLRLDAIQHRNFVVADRAGDCVWRGPP